MTKYVAMAFRPWANLEASPHMTTKPLPYAGNSLPLPILAGKGMGLGFLIVYGSRVEAETANPGVAVLEIEGEVVPPVDPC